MVKIPVSDTVVPFPVLEGVTVLAIVLGVTVGKSVKVTVEFPPGTKPQGGG